MKVFELSKQLGVTNKEVIGFLKDKGFSITSHMQPLTDEMEQLVKANFVVANADAEEKKPEPKKVVKSVKQNKLTEKVVKQYQADDVIACRSLVPWRLCDVGVDKDTVYNWNNFGDIEYVTYRDLQAMRRKSIVKDLKILIEDTDLCERWNIDIKGAYSYYLGVNYPEEFFEVDDRTFEDRLRNAPDVFKDVIKYTAVDMIRNQNYPSVGKLNIIDEVLGTGIKEFI